MTECGKEIDRRSFLRLAGAALGASALETTSCSPNKEQAAQSHSSQGESELFRITFDAQHPQITFLSWDTEATNRQGTNLLRANSPLILRIRIGGQWRASTEIESIIDVIGDGAISYRLMLTPGALLDWMIRQTPDRIAMTVSGAGDDIQDVEAIEMLFPFDPQVTPTTIIPQMWSGECGRLPVVISSPDFGQILLEDLSSGTSARLEGDREKQTVNLVVELPQAKTGTVCSLSFTPVRLAAPKGMVDQRLWQEIRRSWFNTWQPSSHWDDQETGHRAPAGILANNVISDPVSFALQFYADQALWTPEIAPGISVMDQVRHTIEWWLETGIDSKGELIGYWSFRNFLDANAGILIACWDYVEATSDLVWLKEFIDRLELLSEFLEQRDIDGDGLVEAVQSGDYNTLIEPMRSCSWWDVLNCGHKDGYTNAIIYRAWLCLAELEGRLGRRDRQMHLAGLASHLKAAYYATLFNPVTGWLAWWKSADGRLHDYAAPIVNGLAIEYGLVEPGDGKNILSRLRWKMRQVGFDRLDLGLPCALVPVHKADYLQPDGTGIPTREDGTDTFQTYMNGGISAGHALHFIMAYYIVGDPDQGDEILQLMLARNAKSGFQNGVQNKVDGGIDWTDWSGELKGYEGYLADVFMFMQAAILREPTFRARFYRPLGAQPTSV